MPERKSVKELQDMHPDRLSDYLHELEVFTEEEWKLYKETISDPYHLKEITRSSFQTEGGTSYLISVERFHDGEAPDKRNTRIHIVKQK